MHIVIIGGGIIGLGIADESLRRGWQVTIVERDACGQATSRVAAGMLVPLAEAQFGEEDIYRLNATSLERYPEWVERLQRDTGMDLAFQTRGTLIVARDADEMGYIRHFFDLYHQLNPEVELLTPRQAHQREPALSLDIAGALLSPRDYQIDNWRLLSALFKTVQSRGARILEHTPVIRVHLNGHRCTGIETTEQRIEGDVYVIAAGPWSSQIDGLTDRLPLPVRPVKGQVIVLTPTELAPPPEYVIRGMEAYLVPKPDRLIVGATQEEVGFDPHPTAGGIYSILDNAYELVPGIWDMALRDIMVGLRPATPDHKPILGPTPIENLVVATGHFRHGILLMPITAELVVEYIATGQVPSLMQPFLYERFASAPPSGPESGG